MGIWPMDDVGEVPPERHWLMNSTTTAAAVRKLKTIGDTEQYLWQASPRPGNPIGWWDIQWK